MLEEVEFPLERERISSNHELARKKREEAKLQGVLKNVCLFQEPLDPSHSIDPTFTSSFYLFFLLSFFLSFFSLSQFTLPSHFCFSLCSNPPFLIYSSHLYNGTCLLLSISSIYEFCFCCCFIF